MKNHVNQGQPVEYSIYLKDLRQWIPVSKTVFDSYYRDINAYRRKQQSRGRCWCPAKKRYLCDMECWTCPFCVAAESLSLDKTLSDGDENEMSHLDLLQDESPSAQSLLEEQELLEAILAKLDKLDPDGRQICKLHQQGKTEREIADIMGVRNKSTINFKKRRALAALRAALRDFI